MMVLPLVCLSRLTAQVPESPASENQMETRKLSGRRHLLDEGHGLGREDRPGAGGTWAPAFFGGTKTNAEVSLLSRHRVTSPLFAPIGRVVFSGSRVRRFVPVWRRRGLLFHP